MHRIHVSNGHHLSNTLSVKFTSITDFCILSGMQSGSIQFRAIVRDNNNILGGIAFRIFIRMCASCLRACLPHFNSTQKGGHCPRTAGHNHRNMLLFERLRVCLLLVVLCKKNELVCCIYLWSNNWMCDYTALALCACCVCDTIIIRVL